MAAPWPRPYGLLAFFGWMGSWTVQPRVCWVWDGPVWGETAKLVNSRQYADAASVAIGNNCLSDELHQHLYAASFTLMAPWGHRVAWGV